MITNFTPSQWLKIELANQYGQDKRTWDERLAFVDEHLPTNFENCEPDCEELAFSARKAWDDYINKRPSGYPISLDATASGSQMLTMLTTDFKAAKICNLDSKDARIDLYTLVFNKMKELDPSVEELGLSRDQVKKAIMTALYGSVVSPLQTFGDTNVCTLFFATLEEVMPKCLDWMERVKYTAYPAATVQWVMPDCFQVKIRNNTDLVGSFNPTDEMLEAMDSAGVNAFYLQKTKYKYTVNFNPACPGEKIHVDYTYSKMRPKKNPADFRYLNTTMSTALMPDICHAFDSYIAREIIRAAQIPEDIKQGSFVKVSENNRVLYDKYVDMLLHYGYLIAGKDIPILSFAVFNYLSKDKYDSLTKEEKDRIDALRARLPKSVFDVKPIHDSFAVLPNHATELRTVAHTLYQDIARNGYYFRQYLAKQARFNIMDFNDKSEEEQINDCERLADIIKENAEYFIC